MLPPTVTVALEGYSGASDASVVASEENFTSDLIARGLVLEYNGVRSVHINFEACSAIFNFRKAAKAAGTTVDYISMSCTHNHHAPGSLSRSATTAIENAIEDAVNRLVPVKVGMDTYGTQFGCSRSPSYSLDLESPYDNTVTVIRFDNAENNEPLGLIYNVPIHNTAFGNSYPDNWKYLNCEFTGYASRYLEALHAENENFAAMHINGFFGNSGPYFADKESQQYVAYELEELKKYGEAFGAEIFACYDAICGETVTGVSFASHNENIIIQRAELTEDIIRYHGAGTSSSLSLRTMSIGDVAYIGVDCEPFSTYGARLRAEGPFEYLLPAACVGGWNGYIGLQETYHTGRREVELTALKTPFDETVEEQFYPAALNILCQLKGVSYVRTPSILESSAESDGERIYTFVFENEIAPDKLVLSFGESSRLNCAENFSLEAFDRDENSIYTATVQDNSVNHLGFSMQEGAIAKAVLTVSSTYRSETPRDIEVSLHAMNYEPMESQDE